MTSFQVVARIRKILHVKKAGHCGTLDPFASGVLPICIGKATRVVRYMDGYDKSYRCTVRFGAFTDTEDKEGKIIGGQMPSQEELSAMKADDFSDIRRLFSELPGEKNQMPPMYSAIKKDGHPLYEYARQGITIERELRRIRIYDCLVHSITADEFLSADFTVSVSKGTYIRTICNGLGVDTGFGAYADALCRTVCGPFLLENSYNIEDIERLMSENRSDEFLLPEELAVKNMPGFTINEEEASRIRQGQQMDLSQFEGRLTNSATGDGIVHHHSVFFDGKLMAVVFPDVKEGREILRIERVLV
jgi:tRNA pseudouridine55 synthase